MPADEIAVQHFCPEFTEGFHVLETATITGSFTLNDDSPSTYSPSIDVDGSDCEGTGGYSDVNAGTPVTVKNGKGGDPDDELPGAGPRRSIHVHLRHHL